MLVTGIDSGVTGSSSPGPGVVDGFLQNATASDSDVHAGQT